MARAVALVLIAASTACARLPVAEAPAVVGLTVHPFSSPATPAPLQEIRAGRIRAVVPDTWEARLLPRGRYPWEGFFASPKIRSWQRRPGHVDGLEAFWLDVARVGIPSDFYYLAARGRTLGPLSRNKGCHPSMRRVFVNRPPDMTGRRSSPGDYVASATGTCRSAGKRARWVSVVAAPGFGPARKVGIPTSGLYMMVAVVSGPRSGVLLKEILRSARFGESSIPEIVDAARAQAR